MEEKNANTILLHQPRTAAAAATHSPPTIVSSSSSLLPLSPCAAFAPVSAIDININIDGDDKGVPQSVLVGKSGAFSFDDVNNGDVGVDDHDVDDVKKSSSCSCLSRCWHRCGDMLANEPVTYLTRKMWHYSSSNRRNFIIFNIMFILSNLVAATDPLILAWLVNVLQYEGIKYD
jgi:hypothetical protein